MDSETVDEIKRHVTEGLQELRTEIQEVRQHSDVVAERLKAELRAEIQDVKRHSDVIAESLRGEIRLVAEGVTGLDEKFTVEFKNVREEIGEVKSLLRLSYSDLDRRIKPS
jgi:hypothetical protein